MLTEQIPIVAPVRTRVVEFGRSGPANSRGPRRPVHARLLRKSSRLPLDHQDQWRGGALLQRQPHLAADPEARRGRALDLHQRRRRLGPPHPPALRGRHHHEPGRCAHPGNRKARPQGRLAAAPSGQGPVPDPVRRIRRLLREPLPQHGARRLRHADAHPAARQGPARRRRRVTPTPNPTPDGVTFTTPEILPEGDPRHRQWHRRRQQPQHRIAGYVCRQGAPGALRLFVGAMPCCAGALCSVGLLGDPHAPRCWAPSRRRPPAGGRSYFPNVTVVTHDGKTLNSTTT